MITETDLINATYGLLDFHTHTTHSDGGDTPIELVKRAKTAGVSAMALTDHNVISGLDEFLSACKQENIFAIPFGTEIYAELPEEILTPEDNDAPDLIILGKNPKPNNLKYYHEKLSGDRKERWIPESMDKLKKIGFIIPTYDLEEQSRDLGTPSIFHDVFKHSNNLERLIGYLAETNAEIKGVKVAAEEIRKQPIRFANRFLYAIGKPGYSPRIRGFNVQDALELTNAMNCLLIIAHPGGEYGFLSDKILQYYIKSGVSGIEVRSYFNTAEQNKKFDNLATEHNLTRSGGSDCHGNNGPFKIGIHDRPQNQVPKEILTELWEALPD